MSKYDALRDFLEKRSGTVTVTLDELDAIVPGGLAPSARQYPIWWMNDDPTHAHSRSWGEAGYDATPDLERNRVTFTPRSANPHL